MNCFYNAGSFKNANIENAMENYGGWMLDKVCIMVYVKIPLGTVKK